MAKDELTIDKMLNTFLAIDERVEEWSSHPHSSGTKTKRFDDIGAASHTAVYIHFKMLEDFRVMFTNLEKCKERRWGTAWRQWLCTALTKTRAALTCRDCGLHDW